MAHRFVSENMQNFPHIDLNDRRYQKDDALTNSSLSVQKWILFIVVLNTTLCIRNPTSVMYF